MAAFSNGCLMNVGPKNEDTTINWSQTASVSPLNVTISHGLMWVGKNTTMNYILINLFQCWCHQSHNPMLLQTSSYQNDNAKTTTTIINQWNQLWTIVEVTKMRKEFKIKLKMIKLCHRIILMNMTLIILIILVSTMSDFINFGSYYHVYLNIDKLFLQYHPLPILVWCGT